jgi:hypothetical protein
VVDADDVGGVQPCELFPIAIAMGDGHSPLQLDDLRVVAPFTGDVALSAFVDHVREIIGIE